MSSRRSSIPGAFGLLTVVLFLLAAMPAAAQSVSGAIFSIDARGPTYRLCDCAIASSLTEGDLLGNPGALNNSWPCVSSLPTCFPAFGPSTPGILICDVPGGPCGVSLGLTGNLCVQNPCPTSQFGGMCQVEVDAVSFGQETITVLLAGDIKFSVDKFAEGLPLPAGVAYPCVPTVLSQGVLGAMEAHADVFCDVLGFSLTSLPMGPPAYDTNFSDRGNVGVLDGDGCRNSTGFQYWGDGLVEQGSAGSDTLDALELDSYDPQFPIFFSLDGTVTDPLQPMLAWQGSALAHNVSPAAILTPGAFGGPPVVFVTAPALGLDLSGDNTDDLDALAMNVVDNVPNWILFSVRRGSAVIGQNDSRWGAPIEPGDILDPPGTPGLRPGIYIPAEALGLKTARTHGVGHGDELDALVIFGDSLKVLDCNSTNLEDAAEIANGLANDCNANGVPDSCELDSDGDGIIDACDSVGTPYCFGVDCPCGNNDVTAGCSNSTGFGALLSASGSAFTANQACLSTNTALPAHRLVLVAAGLPPNRGCLFFQGDNQLPSQPQFGDGLRCAGTNVIRLQTVVSDAAGFAQTTVDIATAGGVSVGSTKYYQGRYRDTPPDLSACATGLNLTNGISILWQ